MKLFKVSFGSRIAGSNDFTYLLASGWEEALENGKKMLNTHKLFPNFLNDYGRYEVEEVQP